MSLSNIPASERIHIGIFGKRNAGKSSLINAITGQELAIVSETKGTTTDPVVKTMELLPLGPVVIIDTPGLDDWGNLGIQRIKKAYQILSKTDIALLVLDGRTGLDEDNRRLLAQIRDRKIPYLLVYNKLDLTDEGKTKSQEKENTISVSASKGTNIEALKEKMAHLIKEKDANRPIVRDLIAALDIVVLVTPIDNSAPKGRLILPQQMTIRDILEADAIPVLTKENTLKSTLSSLNKKPALVITDSQVFPLVSSALPSDIPLTSFSILFARYKGSLELLLSGVKALDGLADGTHILISEGCTHHRQCEDIGTVKLPKWIEEHSGKQFHFTFTQGTEFPQDFLGYDLIIHCGGCMLNEKEMMHRLRGAEASGVPITNYGICIAYMKGILERAIKPFL